MIQLHTWPTPNGHKIQIMLEEVGVPYTVCPVDIIRGAQFNPQYLALNPNNKVPTIVDEDGPGGKPLTVFETGAILIYLADKTGQLMPSDPRSRSEVMQWLMWQMGGLGPMLGQAQHFHRYATEKVPYAIERYTKEGRRLLGAIKVAELPGAGEGNRTLVFSLEVSKYCSVFKGRSDIFQLFDLLGSLRNFSLSEWRLRAPWSQNRRLGREVGSKRGHATISNCYSRSPHELRDRST